MGGDPETSTSVSGDLHRRWVDVKAMFTGKDEEAYSTKPSAVKTMR